VALARDRESLAREHLVDLLARAPTSLRDHRLWSLAAPLGADTGELVAAVARRACRSTSRTLAVHAAKFLAAHARSESHAGSVQSALLADLDAPGLPQLLRLASMAPTRSHLARAFGEVGVAWLEQHPRAVEWAGTWQAAFGCRTPTTRDQFTDLALEWLSSQPDTEASRAVVGSLVVSLQVPATSYLDAEREGEGGWTGPMVCWTLRSDSEYAPALREIANRWLATHQHPMWGRIFCVIGDRRDARVAESGVRWLADYPGASSWCSVFAALYDASPTSQLRTLTLAWSEQHDRPPRWPLVWRVLIRHGDANLKYLAPKHGPNDGSGGDELS
jgi:hypothetical protein